MADAIYSIVTYPAMYDQLKEEVFRTFLHGDAAEECHYFFFCPGRIDTKELFTQGGHCVDFNYMRLNDLGCIEFSGRYPDNLLEEINKNVMSMLPHSHIPLVRP